MSERPKKQEPSDPPGDGPSGEYVVQGGKRAELHVRWQFTELMLQSREIEGQTRVTYMRREMLLWEALKIVTETCFWQWSRADGTPRDAFIRQVLAIKERCAKEGHELVQAALKNPLQAKAIARTLLLGHNFLRTLDICMEALLRYPSQKSITRKPMKTEVVIDWAAGGVRDWMWHYPYAFEKAGRGQRTPQRMAHVSRHYSTDRTVRSQISHKQIANIFMLRETTVADLERRGLLRLRSAFKPPRGGKIDLSDLAGA